MDGSFSEYIHLSEKTEREFISFTDTTNISIGDIAAIVYLWNPFTIVSCVGGCTAPIENAMVILSLYGAVAGGNSTFFPFIPDTKAYDRSQFLCKFCCRKCSACDVWMGCSHAFFALSCNLNHSCNYVFHFLFIESNLIVE